ncbi:unnamed protein product [Phaeothamnion confervicola]
MLINAAHQLDPHESEYLTTAENVMAALCPVFDRVPRYAWIAKQLLEPERALTFRVSWLDDKGTVRVNRGYRMQYSSALGPYEGPLHFRWDLTSGMIKAHAFDLVLMNALTGLNIGAAVGGVDFNARDKSEAEIQRFCASYMVELAKYIGEGVDSPSMGSGVGAPEIGYLYGQYKRLKEHTYSQSGSGLLWGGMPRHAECTGYGVAYFANEMLKDKADGLRGKRCLITGSGKVALYAAEKLLELGAIPITLSDTSGHVLEPDGIDAAKLQTILKIKEERGARVGRYIIASTTAKFRTPEDIFAIPCDVAFLCATNGELNAAAAKKLADNGCKAVVDGAWAPVKEDAMEVLRTRGIFHAPYRASMLGGTVASARLEAQAFPPSQQLDDIDDAVEAEMAKIYKEVNDLAQEYGGKNGSLNMGACIGGFLRVAKHMLAHGAV